MNHSTLSIDALSMSAARADAVLALLAAQFDTPDTEQHPAEISSEAIGAVRAELAAVRALIAEHLEVAL